MSAGGEALIALVEEATQRCAERERVGVHSGSKLPMVMDRGKVESWLNADKHDTNGIPEPPWWLLAEAYAASR